MLLLFLGGYLGGENSVGGFSPMRRRLPTTKLSEFPTLPFDNRASIDQTRAPHRPKNEAIRIFLLALNPWPKTEAFRSCQTPLFGYSFQSCRAPLSILTLMGQNRSYFKLFYRPKPKAIHELSCLAILFEAAIAPLVAVLFVSRHSSHVAVLFGAAELPGGYSFRSCRAPRWLFFYIPFALARSLSTVDIWVHRFPRSGGKYSRLNMTHSE